MKIANLIQELEETPHYETFQTQNKTAFFATAFLILNLENNANQIQLDYFLPEENKIAAFAHPSGELKIHDNIISVSNGETAPSKVPEMKPQTHEIKIDICDLEKTSSEILKENECGLKPTKIIAILKDNVWNLTLMDNTLGIVRLKLDAISGEAINFDKGSLMDFMGIKKR